MTAASPARKGGTRAETPITAESIVDTAFRMIDERGHEAFSMRSVANELGVFPATLYWHVGDRAQLLGLVELQWVNGIEMPESSVLNSDPNFRPVDMEFAPDGSLFIVDWAEALIGHMQYSIRDPPRDKTHGRVWGIWNAERPLVKPVKIAA